MLCLLLTLLLPPILLIIALASYYSSQYHTTWPELDEVQKRARRAAMFPELDPDRSTVLSVVIPCYNEQERLPPMLRDACLYLEAVTARAHAGGYKPVFDAYEIIVVDDCSSDRTAEVTEAFFAKHRASTKAGEGSGEPSEAAPSSHLHLVRVSPNRGKGHAVRTGFFSAIGDYVLMADGDNATKFEDVGKLFKAMINAKKRYGEGKQGELEPAIAIGSRAHLEKKSIATRTLSRTVLMIGFHLVVDVTYFITTGHRCHLKDTQCGFKLFDRKKCAVLFKNNRLERWAFDVELLLLARRCGLDVMEVCVNWLEIPGSKVRLMGMVQMGLECALMCLAYPLRLWPINRNTSRQ